jgi:hypothetical protein
MVKSERLPSAGRPTMSTKFFFLSLCLSVSLSTPLPHTSHTRPRRPAANPKRSLAVLFSAWNATMMVGRLSFLLLLPRWMLMKMTKISSMSRRRLLLLWVLLVLSILLPLTQSQQPPPPQQQEECFSTIASLQGVMATELSRIANGGAVPAASYTFILCPNTFLDASTMPLQPLLDKSTFMCGNDGHVRNRCVIVGNGSNNNTTTTTDAQVRIVDSTTPGHVLQQVDFIGLTFTDFTSNNGATSTKRIGQSIAAAASTSTTATFKGCAWQVRCLFCGVSSSSLRRGYCFLVLRPVYVCLFVCLCVCVQLVLRR